MRPYVLVAAAESEARDAIAGALAEGGCDVDVVRSPGDADVLLDGPGQRPPDVLVLDDRGADEALGELDATAFLERVRGGRWGHRVAVLLVASGHAGEPLALADTVLVRPVTAEALAQAVAQEVLNGGYSASSAPRGQDSVEPRIPA